MFIKQLKTKRKAIGKTNKKVSLRKSQLTPRMALYIPPHLQKTTQQISTTPKQCVRSPPVQLSPEQEKEQKRLVAELKEMGQTYQQMQHQVKSKQNKSLNLVKESKRIPVKKVKMKLPKSDWTKEMNELLVLKNSSYENFIKTGCEGESKIFKEAKVKFRSLLRKARSTPKSYNNPYQVSENSSTKLQSSEQSTEKIESSGDASFSQVEIMEDEYDASQYLAYTQRKEATQEWYRAIVSFRAKISSRKRLLSDVVKIEILDSDEDVPAVASTRFQESQGRICQSTDGSTESTRSSPDVTVTNSHHTGEASMDVSNNEYLNQQFLRRQHDYEREQKFHQIELESKSGGQLSPLRRGDLFADFNFGRNREMMSDPMRKYDTHSPLICDNSAGGNLPKRQNYDDLLSLEKPPPPEPFVGERNRNLLRATPSASGDATAIEEPMVKHLMSELYSDPMHGMNGTTRSSHRQYPYEPPQNSSSSGSYPSASRYPKQMSPFSGRNQQMSGSPRDIEGFGGRLSPYSERRGGQKQLSPYSNRYRNGASSNNNDNNLMELSPYSDMLRHRHTSRQLSPYSDLMRSRGDSPPSRQLSPYSSRLKNRDERVFDAITTFRPTQPPPTSQSPGDHDRRMRTGRSHHNGETMMHPSYARDHPCPEDPASPPHHHQHHQYQHHQLHDHRDRRNFNSRNEDERLVNRNYSGRGRDDHFSPNRGIREGRQRSPAEKYKDRGDHSAKHTSNGRSFAHTKVQRRVPSERRKRSNERERNSNSSKRMKR